MASFQIIKIILFYFTATPTSSCSHVAYLRDMRAMQQEAIGHFGNILASIFPPRGAKSTVRQPFTHQWRSGTSSIHVDSRDGAPSTVPHSYSDEEEPYERVMIYL